MLAQKSSTPVALADLAFRDVILSGHADQSWEILLYEVKYTIVVEMSWSK